MTWVLGVVLLWAGCDAAGEQEREEPPDIDRVELRVTALDGRSVRQEITVRLLGAEPFQADERLLLVPGEYHVDLRAFEQNESVIDYLTGGPDVPLLRYDLTGGLAARIQMKYGLPKLVPLDGLSASLGEARTSRSHSSSAKTAPEPIPGFTMTVADTVGTVGAMRLVLERYESRASYRRGTEPLRTDFDVRFSIRTIPRAEE